MYSVKVEAYILSNPNYLTKLRDYVYPIPGLKIKTTEIPGDDCYFNLEIVSDNLEKIFHLGVFIGMEMVR